jgi:hypothetical protein
MKIYFGAPNKKNPTFEDPNESSKMRGLTCFFPREAPKKFQEKR